MVAGTGVNEYIHKPQSRIAWQGVASTNTGQNLVTDGTDYAIINEVMICDLTAMFGAGNEPETVEDFKALFPKDYYPYNAGTVTTVSAVNGDEYLRVPIKFGALGKNLIDPAKRTQYSSTIYEWYRTNGFLLKAGVTYSLSANYSGSTVYINSLNDGADLAHGLTPRYTPDEDVLVYFRYYRSGGAQEDVALQLEKSSSATAFEPYNDTVYGGYLQLNQDGSVDLVGDRANQIFDGTENVEANTTYHYIKIPVSLKHPTDVSISEIGVSSLFPISNTANTDRIAISNEQSVFWFWAQGRRGQAEWYDNSAAFKSFLADQYANGRPLQICYKLLEPVTYHLPSLDAALKAFKGLNIMFSDLNENMVIEARAATPS